MKKLIIILISINLISFNVNSQSGIDNVLEEVVKNNTTLSALRKHIDAEKISNKTGIYLDNPEIGFNYLWGNPSSMGTRTDFSITQSFDFPTAYGYKNQISNLKNEQTEIEYKKQLQTVLLQTRIVCVDLVYTNALKSELTKRVNFAKSIAESYKAKFDIGETNILEFNKAQLNLLNLKKELDAVEIERIALLSDLTRLNGGKPIIFTEKEFQASEIPVDFEQWYVQAEQNNPMLSWLKQEVEINQKQQKLNRAMSLPKLQTGYMSEKVVGEQFQGVTVGLSIPLWQNKNSVKYSKANATALEEITIDNKLQLYNRLKTIHAKAMGLQKNANDYRQSLQTYDNSKLLKKAFDKGEISLIEYILELSIYYESVNNLLEMDRNLNMTLAELFQYM